MDPTKGIQTLPDHLRGDLTTLASDTAEIIGLGYGPNLTRDFLLKKIRTQLYFGDLFLRTGLIVGFARGDMTIAEIATVLATELPDPEDYQKIDDYAKVNGIFWETLRIVDGTFDDVGGAGPPVQGAQAKYEITQSLGGGKGLPLEAGHGIQMFVFNPSSVTINDSTKYAGTYQLVGVWMEGSN